ncbi:hypothetical protein NEF87_004355 [Candidatus Lokiarchaeum ossiferum]|uniref:Methyltransferase type 11 domain-containing protein n=1 Tax=Candidatus Lokiarchaeum ossiferum TaxID=2951803 RepID=A0ABY6HX13_9ARCH|nr:hypothetical protein NEF87_004355 [Candidatus Lokiarchaeum sp. B-35]
MSIKKLIWKTFNKLGLKIERINKVDNSYLPIYKRLYKEEALKEKRFYNVGAGEFSHPYWTNIDKHSDWYSKAQQTNSFLEYDLFSLEKLPIQDDSAEVIYSSHVVEHISDEAAQNLFNESYRILKEGGIFRFTTPNTDLGYRAVKNNDRDYYYCISDYSTKETMERVRLNKPMSEASIEQIFLFEFASQLSEIADIESPRRISDEEFNKIFEEKSYEEALNYITSMCSKEIQGKYPGFHINWWNKEKSFRMLKKAGFSKIYLSAWGQSFSPILRETRLFDKTHPKISIYVEAIK